MERETLTTTEVALRDTLARSPETDPISPEEIIEVANRGRKHPQFDSLLARIAANPSALALYRAARTTRPKSALQKKAEEWYENLLQLPKWFEDVIASVQRTPAPAYRSGSSQATPRLLSPDPGNQSVLPGVQDWKFEAEESDVAIEQAGKALAAGDPLEPGTVTVVVDGEDAWSLDGDQVFRFQVLDSAAADRVRWAESNAQAAPVAAALTLFSLGRFADAERLIARWPNDPDLAAWASLIRLSCEARRMDARELF